MSTPVMKMPWEPPDENPLAAYEDTARAEANQQSSDPLHLKYPEQSDTADLARVVELIQKDILFAVQYTAVLVRSSNEALRMVVNTKRGQSMPRGDGIFTDGTTIELQDIGMPQPGCPVMTVQDLLKLVLAKAAELGLDLA